MQSISNDHDHDHDILETGIGIRVGVGVESINLSLQNNDMIGRISLLASHPFSDIAAHASQLECLLDRFDSWFSFYLIITNYHFIDTDHNFKLFF